MMTTRIEERTKILFLYFCKYIGLFRFAMYLTRNRLRILCYHGFGKTDEFDWRPGLFMRAATFRKRLVYIKSNGFHVLSLGEAVKHLKTNDLPELSTVITIDDGWFDNLDVAHPILKTYKFPYTIYQTSYYSLKQSPLYNIVIPYMLWKTHKTSINLKHANIPLQGNVNIGTQGEKDKLSNELIDYGHKSLNNEQRYEVLQYISDVLGVDFEKINSERLFHLLNSEEIKAMACDGVDFQLHAHRHCWPKSEQDARRELDENKKFLEPLIGKELKHFCYPSGIWTKEQLPFLSNAGIQSATTCDFGLNSSGDNVFCLKRILDGEDKTQIEFEAELSGFKSIIKMLIRK